MSSKQRALNSMPKSKVISRRKRNNTNVEVAPPVINLTPTVHHTFRYVASSSFTGSVNSTGLLACAGIVCTATNTTAFSIAGTMRIRKVCIYPASGTLAAISWFDNTRAEDIEMNQDQPLGTTVPTRIQSSPPPKSLSSMWFNATLNQNIMGLIVPAGSVVDVTLEYTTTNNYSGTSFGIATGVIGTFYYAYLDGFSTHKLQPSGLPNTF